METEVLDHVVENGVGLVLDWYGLFEEEDIKLDSLVWNQLKRAGLEKYQSIELDRLKRDKDQQQEDENLNHCILKPLPGKDALQFITSLIEEARYTEAWEEMFHLNSIDLVYSDKWETFCVGLIQIVLAIHGEEIASNASEMVFEMFQQANPKQAGLIYMHVLEHARAFCKHNHPSVDESNESMNGKFLFHCLVQMLSEKDKLQHVEPSDLLNDIIRETFGLLLLNSGDRFHSPMHLFFHADEGQMGRWFDIWLRSVHNPVQFCQYVLDSGLGHFLIAAVGNMRRLLRQELGNEQYMLDVYHVGNLVSMLASLCNSFHGRTIIIDPLRTEGRNGIVEFTMSNSGVCYITGYREKTKKRSSNDGVLNVVDDDDDWDHMVKMFLDVILKGFPRISGNEQLANILVERSKLGLSGLLCSSIHHQEVIATTLGAFRKASLPPNDAVLFITTQIVENHPKYADAIIGLNMIPSYWAKKFMETSITCYYDLFSLLAIHASQGSAVEQLGMLFEVGNDLRKWGAIPFLQARLARHMLNANVLLDCNFKSLLFLGTNGLFAFRQVISMYEEKVVDHLTETGFLNQLVQFVTLLNTSDSAHKESKARVLPFLRFLVVVADSKMRSLMADAAYNGDDDEEEIFIPNRAVTIDDIVKHETAEIETICCNLEEEKLADASVTGFFFNGNVPLSFLVRSIFKHGCKNILSKEGATFLCAQEQNPAVLIMGLAKMIVKSNLHDENMECDDALFLNLVYHKQYATILDHEEQQATFLSITSSYDF